MVSEYGTKIMYCQAEHQLVRYFHCSVLTRYISLGSQGHPHCLQLFLLNWQFANLHTTVHHSGLYQMSLKCLSTLPPTPLGSKSSYLTFLQHKMILISLPFFSLPYYNPSQPYSSAYSWLSCFGVSVHCGRERYKHYC